MINLIKITSLDLAELQYQNGNNHQLLIDDDGHIYAREITSNSWIDSPYHFGWWQKGLPLPQIGDVVNREYGYECWLISII